MLKNMFNFNVISILFAIAVLSGSAAADGQRQLYVIGFDIAVGSPEEKSLQDLAQQNGGTYLSAADATTPDQLKGALAQAYAGNAAMSTSSKGIFPIPEILNECETYNIFEICGTLKLEGDHYNAEWENGATGIVKLESLSPTGIVVLSRYDLAGTSAGLSARYEGELSEDGNSILNGIVTWTWNGETWNGTWDAYW